jgi:hypothetical protein
VYFFNRFILTYLESSVTAALDQPFPVDHAFSTSIGVNVEGDIWSAIEVTDSAKLFGSLRSVRVDAAVDEVLVENMGLMPTGSGELMLSVSAALRKKLGKKSATPSTLCCCAG